MPALIRSLASFGAVFCLLSSLSAVPAHAQTPPDINLPAATQPAASPPVINPELSAPTHKHKTHYKVAHHKKAHHSSHTAKKHKVSKTVKKNTGVSKIREVQTHLANLEYYKGKIDGLNGSRTKAAIKKFQHDHKLPATGKLNQQTYDAIVQADKEKAMSSLPPIVEAIKEPTPKPVVTPPMPAVEEPPVTAGPDFYATHPDFYGHYHQAYENPLLLGPTQTLYSRFARIDLTEDASQQDSSKRYNITLNGLPLILVDGQPSVIGVSRTFALGDEDVIIFTTFKDRDPVCAYAYNLLILSSDGTKSREVNNCTRGYQAKVSNGSLFITFPESDDARAVGNTWRYEKGDLEKL